MSKRSSNTIGLAFASALLLLSGLCSAYVQMVQQVTDLKDANGASVEYTCGNSTLCQNAWSEQISKYVHSGGADNGIDAEACTNACVSSYIYSTCPAEYQKIISTEGKAQCITNDQVCQNKYGATEAWTGSYNDAGGLNCGCKTGYEMNYKGQCIDDNQGCKNDFGDNSIWSGQVKNDGSVGCDCMPGYDWNSGATACVIKQEQQQTPPTSGLQCNGKSWNACPAGQTFSCPASGDPTCVSNQTASSQNISSNGGRAGSGGGSSVEISGSGGSGSITTITPPKRPTAPTSHSAEVSQVVQKATIAKTTAVLSNAGNSATTSLPINHPGLFPRVWSWLLGIFGH